ncbi:MAG: TetR/AcrR family transcriptional regulator [Beijerinckiaceae bacterium]|nr:TetR/AcrR family transcriptional regulator [Beijerinckiaceae bacterium]
MSGPEGEGDKGARRGYHHGRLKDALIEAARNLIEQRGPQGFSLTEAARLVGVTPAAPYRHFSDREALMGEVARRGFDLFNDRLRAAWDGGRPDAGAALARMGRAYLDFAREEPGYYRGMFTQSQNLAQDLAIQRKDSPELCAPAPPSSAAASFAVIEQAAAALARGGPGADPSRLALEIWALAHGVATLMLGGYLPSQGGVDAYGLLQSGVSALVDGAGRRG